MLTHLYSQIVLSDTVVCWRAYIVLNRRSRVVIVICVLLICATAGKKEIQQSSHLLTCHAFSVLSVFSADSDACNAGFSSMGGSFTGLGSLVAFSLSLFTNICAVASIAWKTWYVP